MTTNPFIRGAATAICLSLIIIIGGVKTSSAKSHPVSLDDIRPLLPDSVSLDSHVVYVDFWASWCVYCRHSFPWMEEIYSQLRRDGLVIIAINVDREHAAALKFLADNPAYFPIVYDSTGSLAKKFQLDAMPTSFLFDRDGKLVKRYDGFNEDDVDKIRDNIVDLLREGGSK